jgi:hypothetical protein
MAGPTAYQRLPVGQLIGPGGLPVDFQTRPTINGTLLGPLPYTQITTLTVTAPSFVSAAGVTWGSLSYVQDGNNTATLSGIAVFTPSTTATSGGYGSFTIAVPNRTTNFVDKKDAKVAVESAFDDTDGNLYGCFGRVVPASTTAIIYFFPNNATSLHYIPFTLKYLLV